MQDSLPERIDLISLPRPHEVLSPPDEGCPNCGSSNTVAFESYGETGVCAPDGTREHQHEAGVHCSDCGTNAEPERREWLREAFQIVAGRSRRSTQREHLVALTLHFRELVSALFEVPTPKEVN